MSAEAIDAGKAKALLAAVVSEVFAEVAFIDARPLVTDEVDGSHGNLSERVTVDVLRPLSCRIGLALSSGLKSKISAILQPAAEVDGSGDTEDAILELLNIIAGSFITAYFGAGTDIKLGLPQCAYLEEDMNGTEHFSARVDFDAEGEGLSASLDSIRYRY